MKSRTLTCIIAMILLAALAILARLVAQEQQNESATTVTANPVPLINQPLMPGAVRPSNPGFRMTVNGTGFVTGSVVKWNGSARVTTFVSGSRLTASILSSDIAKPSTARVTVVNPTPGGGTSNVVLFEVTKPTSSISLGKSEFAAGSRPASVATADFNGDGKLDLALANNGSHNVSVLLGKGDGTFKAAVNYPTGSAPRSVVVGDFNRDGKLDLAVANTDSNDVSVLLGNGDGTFKAAVNVGVGLVPLSVVVGDFNGDGNLDLAVANFNSNNVSVLLGKGNGTFQAAVDYSVGSAPTSVAVGDFNRDGKLDLAVANADGHNLSVLLGKGDGTFQAAVDYPTGECCPFSVAEGDFNGDGKLDVALANDFGTVAVLLGNGDGTFQSAVSYGIGGEVFSVAEGDFNGDGKLDLAVTQSSSSNVGFSILFGNGNGTFQPPVKYSVGQSPNQLVAGDFNGDGRLDLAVANSGNTNQGAVFVMLQGTLGLSETALKFADQVVETSSAGQAVKLTNIGSLALSISTIAITGINAADFTQTHTCGSSLSPGASCAIGVTFKPTKLGPRRASITITDSTPGSPQSVALSGTGVMTGPNATLSPTSLTFATQLVGTTSRRSVMLSNYGTTTLNIASISASGDFSQANTCGSSLTAGGSCTISVAFKPSQGGTLTGTLSVTDNAPGSPQRVSLRGIGTVVELAPTSLAFECGPFGFRQSCVCTPPRTTTLTNVGSTPLDIAGIAISGSSTFSQTNTCGSSVGAGNNCAITVTWSHATACSGFSPCRGEISVSDNGGASPQTVSLTGDKLCTP